jgi:hypothetical protein
VCSSGVFDTPPAPVRFGKGVLSWKGFACCEYDPFTGLIARFNGETASDSSLYSSSSVVFLYEEVDEVERK